MVATVIGSIVGTIIGLLILTALIDFWSKMIIKNYFSIKKEQEKIDIIDNKDHDEACQCKICKNKKLQEW